MPQEQSLVKVAYRGITLMKSAVIQDLTEHGGFVQTDRPMPVGTTLMIFPGDQPELEVGMSVTGVVEQRKARRGENQPQAGMQLTFQGSSDDFFQALQGFEAEEASFEMNAEPPDPSGDDEAVPREAVTTGDFTNPELEPRKKADTMSMGVTDEEPPEVPEDDDEDEPPEVPEDE